MKALEQQPQPDHPLDPLLRRDRIPHIWCAGCGLGTVLSALVSALQDSGMDLTKLAAVSGIGCSGRAAGYLNIDAFHTTHGRAIPFATGLALVRPDMRVMVISGDGDLAAIGGNHLIHAARRNVDLMVICINNFVYGMTGGQGGPTSMLEDLSTTTPYGNVEPPFNLPRLVAAAGGPSIARWTTFHVRQLKRTLEDALQRRGFRFIEVLSPCPTYYARRNKLGTGLDIMRIYKERCKVRRGAPPWEVDIGPDGPIIVGEFVQDELPTLSDRMNTMTEALRGRLKAVD